MSTGTEESVTTLSNTEFGWVTRRDAADQLGKDALDAIRALRKHTDEKDRDVKIAVTKAMKAIHDAVSGSNVVEVSNEPPSLEKLTKTLQKDRKREVKKTEKGFEVEVILNNFRTQTVCIETGTSRLEQAIVRVSTTCGEAKDDGYRWCLRNNVHFAQCALAIEKVDNVDTLILVNCMLADHITYNELKATVKEIAYYGDWVEDKLTGGDIY